jgi:threonine dehydratase
VAHHAAELGIPATIVMPATTPFTKVAHTEAHGATVVCTGESLAEAAERARQIEAEGGLTFVHPYDDPLVIAGQGTVALEMLEQCPRLEALVAPIGGGGLISGMAVVAKAIKPETEIIGAETALYPSMYQALRGVAPAASGQTIADGIAVKTPGEITRAVCAALVDDILLLDEAAIEAAVQMLIEIEKTVAEGAGAAALAAVRAYPERLAGKAVGLVVSGGNIDSRLLASVLMRGLVRDGRMVRLRIEIPDQPGALAKVAQTIGDAGGNIVEIYHQRLFHDVPVKRADLDVVVETLDRDHVAEIQSALRAAGFEAQLMASTASGGA